MPNNNPTGINQYTKHGGGKKKLATKATISADSLRRVIRSGKSAKGSPMQAVVFASSKGRKASPFPTFKLRK